MRRFLISIALILSTSYPAIAGPLNPSHPVCAPIPTMTAALIKEGYFFYASFLTDQRYFLEIYKGQYGYALTIVDKDKSCLVGTGTNSYLPKEFRI